MAKTRDSTSPPVPASPSTSDDYFILSLQEVTTSFGVSTAIIFEIIDEGIVEIDDAQEDTAWQFDSEACRRIRLVLQLQHDLGINVAGAALVLDLMKEIEELHTRLAAS